MSKPLDLDLYNKVKEMANKVFKSPTGIYRSMWISRKYTELGGLYDKPKSKTKSQHDQININRSIIHNTKSCVRAFCTVLKQLINNIYF